MKENIFNMPENQFDLLPHGINQTKRITSPEAEKILYHPFPVLDHGFVRLVDYLGGDESIVKAARVSYGRGTKQVHEDRGLIRYLMRHRHTTPFEMVELTFHAKMPIFVARQWIRHRTANVNEESARYSVLGNEFYLPDPVDLGIQSKKNRQGRDEPVSAKEAILILEMLKQDSINAYDHYEYLLNEDVKNPGNPKDENRPMLARKLARMNLNLSFYTQWYWKIDLHNLFHFLSLRMDKHAQFEIRVYANKMAEITKAIAPIAYEAFGDYILYATNLSRLEKKILDDSIDKARLIELISDSNLSKREQREFKEKFNLE